jgi:hypothetical protein
MEERTMDTATVVHGDAEVPATGPGCDDREREPSTSETDGPREGCCTVTLQLRPVVADALFAQAEQERRSPSYVADRTLHDHLVGDALRP